MSNPVEMEAGGCAGAGGDARVLAVGYGYSQHADHSRRCAASWDGSSNRDSGPERQANDRLRDARHQRHAPNQRQHGL
jgi:hypothetical protein